MKKALLLLSFLPLSSFAQEIAPPDKNEVGLNLFSVTDFNTYKDMRDGRVYGKEINAFSGIYYRRHFGRYALRASFDYTQKAHFSEAGERNSTYYYSSAGTTKNISISVGYQHAFATKKWQPYFFTDLVFNYINMSGHSTVYGDFMWFENRPFSEEVLEYGLAAGGGLRYSITPKMHLTYEFSGQGVISVFQDVLYAGKKYVDMAGHFNPVNKLGFAVSL